MGYFSNGTEGEIYQEQWCNHCIHRPTQEKGCAVWDAHLLLSYEECNKRDCDQYKRAFETAQRLLESSLEREEMRAEERDLLLDKWKQMEAYGFDSPDAVFSRIETLKKQIHEGHSIGCSCCGLACTRDHEHRVDTNCVSWRGRQ